MSLSQRIETLNFDPRGTAILERAEHSRLCDLMLKDLAKERRAHIIDMAKRNINGEFNNQIH